MSVGNKAIYKVIVVGDSAVGHNSLLTKFSTKAFEEKFTDCWSFNFKRVN